MKTATVRDLRNQFAQVAKWIEEGEDVEITRSGKPFARLAPAPPVERHATKMPDFLARMRRRFPKDNPGKGLSAVVDHDRGDR
ncbi:MAG: type II toxin-antitoxin system prevent-host-death family antitoxin [Luteolibacter sp.]